jgi:SAM-dependent methyltransferase
MFRTTIYGENQREDDQNFDWQAFFSREAGENIFKTLDLERLVTTLREYLREDRFKMTFVLGRMMRFLLKEVNLTRNGRILELGAATGFLSRWLLSQYGGTAVLVDNSKASYQAYCSLKNPFKKDITYVNQDMFLLELAGTFDLVCSFGLIEHFIDKKEVIEVHQRFLAPRGFVLILVPLDTPLTRIFWELHPELNRGYRELLTENEFYDLLEKNGLEVMGTQCSFGYSYDFIGGLCRKK